MRTARLEGVPSHVLVDLLDEADALLRVPRDAQQRHERLDRHPLQTVPPTLRKSRTALHFCLHEKNQSNRPSIQLDD